MDLREMLTSTTVLFKNQEVFSEKYIPDRILGRDEQIRELTSYLKYVTRGSPHPNIIIYGKVGTGKSVVIRYILREIQKFMAEENPDSKFKYSYVLCRDYRSESRILEKIITDVRGEKVSLMGWGINKYYEELRNTLQNFGGVTTVVLDEANLMASPNDLLYNLTRLEVPNADISLICITNSLKFMESLEARVLSSMSPIQVVFPPYNAEELLNILKDRAKVGVVDGVLEDGVLELCAAISAQEEGDARKAIALLKTAVLLAEREGSEKVTTDHIKKASDIFEKDIIRQAITTLPIHNRLILLAIAVTSTFVNEPSMGQIYTVYKHLCQEASVDPLTQRRVSDMIRTLEELELVNTKLLSLGRARGRTRLISLGGSPSYYIETILEDPRLSTLDKEAIVGEVKKILIYSN